MGCRCLQSSAEEHRLAGDPANRSPVGVFVDGQLAGSAGLYREPGRKERHKGHVMQTLLARATRIEGVEQIGLTVTATYESLGFRTFGREHRALKLAGRYVDKEYVVFTCERPTRCATLGEGKLKRDLQNSVE